MSKSIVNRVKKALDQDNTIVTSLDKVQDAKGFTTEYLNYLGLTTNDLKKLERNGLALRGYTNKSTKTTLGRDKSGNQVMWVLLGDSDGKIEGKMQEVSPVESKSTNPISD